VGQINKVGHMRLLAIIFIIFCSFDSMAQYDWDSKNWDKKSLGFGCGFSGQMTKPVSQISKLLTEGNFKELRQLLNSDLTSYQYLSTFVLEKLSDNGDLKLTEMELKKIDQIKNSEQTVPICSGCTYWDERPLRELFDVKTNTIISYNAEYWFERIYKK
jgi:hypothetical protein